MTRSGTTIWHEIMKSESVSKMPDIKTRLIFMGLLMACDDWGRFPDSPHKLAMSMPAFGVTPDDIQATIEWLDGECIARYTARLPGGDRAVAVCQFTNWEEYQWRLKSRDNAKYPSKDGILEATTNPLALSRGHRTVTASQPNEMKGKEMKRKEKNKTAKSRDLPDWCIELVKDLHKTRQENSKDKLPDLTVKEIETQADAIEKLFRLDSYTQKDIDQVLRWAVTDIIPTSSRDEWPGWSAQFHTCASLRVKKGGASKFKKMKAGFRSSDASNEDKFFDEDVDF